MNRRASPSRVPPVGGGRARSLAARIVETLVGAVRVERPYFYCTAGCGGFYPMDSALGLRSGRLQLDVQQVMVDLATEVPYEMAAGIFGLNIA